VQDQQVDLVDSELARALLETVQRLVVAVVADPDLGLQEHLRPVHIRTVNRLSHLALVTVSRRRVDVAVAGVQCGLDGRQGLVRRRLKDTEAKRASRRRS
jgi:hypothetical protein